MNNWSSMLQEGVNLLNLLFAQSRPPYHLTLTGSYLSLYAKESNCCEHLLCCLDSPVYYYQRVYVAN